MRVAFLGTAAGKVAVGERQHSSFAVETGGGVYWLDAGEGCANRAHLAGLGLLQTRAAFVSHMAMDHIAGLPRLLWTVRKLNKQSGGDGIADGLIKLFIPDVHAWRGIIEMLEATTNNNYANNFVLQVSQYGEGCIYDEDGVKVSACHNSHMGRPNPSHGWRSYGFRFEAEGKALVYTGDVEKLEELRPLLEKPCGLLLADAGHAKLKTVCEFLRDHAAGAAAIALIHLGKETLSDPEAAREKAAAYLGKRVFIPNDGDRFEL